VEAERLSFDSPEEAALAGWPTGSHVRVLSVEIRGDRAEVVLDTKPHCPYWMYCMKTAGRWRITVDGNGPCIGWDDPRLIQWTE
jgi:hypothetical protein